MTETGGGATIRRLLPFHFDVRRRAWVDDLGDLAVGLLRRGKHHADCGRRRWTGDDIAPAPNAESPGFSGRFASFAALTRRELASKGHRSVLVTGRGSAATPLSVPASGRIPSRLPPQAVAAVAGVSFAAPHQRRRAEPQDARQGYEPRRSELAAAARYRRRLSSAQVGRARKWYVKNYLDFSRQILMLAAY